VHAVRDEHDAPDSTLSVPPTGLAVGWIDQEDVAAARATATDGASATSPTTVNVAVFNTGRLLR
jgi:hypothetical protein